MVLIPKLLKRAQAVPGIDPKDVNVKVVEGNALRRLQGSLAQIVSSVAELRNSYGAGHGKSNASEIGFHEARLVVSAGTSVAAYLMGLYEAKEKTS